jgi:hypothetical protein
VPAKVAAAPRSTLGSGYRQIAAQDEASPPTSRIELRMPGPIVDNRRHQDGADDSEA